MDAIEESIWDVSSEVHLSTPLEKTLTIMIHVLDVHEEKELEECVKELETLEEVQPWEEEVEILKKEAKEEESKLELKMFLSHLKYVFLDDGGNKPIIISNALS